MKGVILFAVLFLFSLSIVSSQGSGNNCASEDDVILRLSSSTNAHGEIWNGAGAYTTEVCYTDIFGTSYTGTNPHSCSAGNGNKVLTLSSSTNAHAEIPYASSPRYTTNVCYGDLVCQSVVGNVACPANTQEVVSLSSSTNAHLETANANIYAGAGNYKVCCSNTPPVVQGTIGPATWRYFNNLPAPENSLICVNQFMIAHSQATGLANSVQSVVYELWERDGLLNPDDCIVGCTSPGLLGDISNGQTSIPIEITLEIFNAAEESQPEFYFKVKTGSPITQAESALIRVTDDLSQCQYPPPTAVVTAPVHQEVYFADTPINFVATCTSQAGPLTYNWQMVQNGNTITNTEANFQQSFTQGGQVTIALTCTDLQGLSATVQRQVLIVASPFTFAYINDPGYNGVAYTPPSGPGVPYFPLEVSFEAKHTFAVNADSSVCTVTCLGGNCPRQTQNSPSGCLGNVPSSPSNGQAGGALLITGAPANPASAVWSGMTFDWNFWDSDWTNSGSGFEGQGAWGGFLEYDDMSENKNDKHMSVAVQVTSGATTASASFQRDFTLGRCLNNGNTLLNPDGQLVSTNNVNVCNGGDGIPNTGDECCPSGLDCADSDGNPSGTNGPFSCQILSNIITRCEDFTEAGSCNSNTNPSYPLASKDGILPTATCSFLQCFWEDTIGCGVRIVTYPNDPITGQCNTQGCVLSDCTWTTQQTQCINGRKTISYLGNIGGTTGLPICLGGSNSCAKESVTVPCGSLNFELDFFGIKQFIATAIIVVLFYAIFGIRRTGKK